MTFKRYLTEIISKEEWRKRLKSGKRAAMTRNVLQEIDIKEYKKA